MMMIAMPKRVPLCENNILQLWISNTNKQLQFTKIKEESYKRLKQILKGLKKENTLPDDSAFERLLCRRLNSLLEKNELSKNEVKNNTYYILTRYGRARLFSRRIHKDLSANFYLYNPKVQFPMIVELEPLFNIIIEKEDLSQDITVKEFFKQIKNKKEKRKKEGNLTPFIKTYELISIVLLRFSRSFQRVP